MPITDKPYVMVTMYDNDYSYNLARGLNYVVVESQSTLENFLTEEDVKYYLAMFVSVHQTMSHVYSPHQKWLGTLEDVRWRHEYILDNLEVKYLDSDPGYGNENGEFVLYDLQNQTCKIF